MEEIIAHKQYVPDFNDIYNKYEQIMLYISDLNIRHFYSYKIFKKELLRNIDFSKYSASTSGDTKNVKMKQKEEGKEIEIFGPYLRKYEDKDDKLVNMKLTITFKDVLNKDTKEYRDITIVINPLLKIIYIHDYAKKDRYRQIQYI